MGIKLPDELLGCDFNAYSDFGSEKKDNFHRAAKRYLNQVAKELGLPKGSFEVRSNKGGMAVSGEVTLHGESIFVQASESCLSPGISFLFRSCKGREDCSGGRNQFAKAQDIKADISENFLTCLKREIEAETNRRLAEQAAQRQADNAEAKEVIDTAMVGMRGFAVPFESAAVTDLNNLFA